jgi:hypothetical protein
MIVYEKKCRISKKKNAGFQKIKCRIIIKKKVEILHLWKVWTDLKTDAFTSEKMARQM